MRRLSRLIDALGSPLGLWVVAALLDGPATQDELKAALREAKIPFTPATVSALMLRLQDLGLVERDNQKAPYRLRHAEEAAAAVLHLATLGLKISAEEAAEAKALEGLARKARIRSVDQADSVG